MLEKQARLEGGDVSGYENIKDSNSKRTPGERRELAKKAGKASGEARRRKADFKRTLNLLLTAEIDSEEWKPLLESLGLECTLESAMLMAQIKEAMQGNTKAAYFVAQYAGQSSQTETDEEEQRIKVKTLKKKAGEYEEEEPEDDGFLESLKGTAAEDWKEPDDEEADV